MSFLYLLWRYIILCAGIRDLIQWLFYINLPQLMALKVRPCLLVINRTILSTVGDTFSYQIAER